jgi:hypothetical protein
LEVGDTAGLETCATKAGGRCLEKSSLLVTILTDITAEINSPVTPGKPVWPGVWAVLISKSCSSGSSCQRRGHILTTDPGGTKRFQKETGSQVPANPGACRPNAMTAELTLTNLRRTIAFHHGKGKQSEKGGWLRP